MELAVWNVLLAVLVLLVVPVFVGNEICGVLEQEITIAKSFLMGTVSMWGICQIVAVPLILLKQSFFAVVIILVIICTVLIADGVYHKRFFRFAFKANTVWEKLAMIMMFSAMGVLVAGAVFLQHTDADDSRFVVNAVDIVRTNKMFLTNPATGEPLSMWEGELIKDVTSPWAVFIAYCAKLTGIHPAIMAHTILPPVLYILAGCVFWLLSDEFFEEVIYRCVFVCFAILLNIYGYCSIYSAETFFMVRIWQGKAVVAGIGIPLLILMFLWIYRQNMPERSIIILLFLTEIAVCLLSGMGVVIGAIMTGCYGFVYGIIKKDWKQMIAMWCCAIPNAVYYGISLLF